MRHSNPAQVQKGGPPGEDELMYISMARQTLSNNLTFANEVLRHLVSLDSVLLSGFIIFENGMVPQCAKRIVVLLLLGSLILSLVGMLPYEGFVDIRMPDEVRMHKEHALNWKRTFLFLASCTLVAGLVMAFVYYI